MKVGYMVSEYPARSHTFIRREIDELEGGGLTVFRYSQRKMALNSALTDDDKIEIEKTFSFYPARFVNTFFTNLIALMSAPRRYLSALLWLVSKRSPEKFSLLYTLVYFFQGIYFSRKMKADGIGQLHVHFVNSGVYVGAAAAKFLNIPWSASVHGRSDFDYPGVHALLWVVEEVNFLRCISQFGAAQVMRQTSTSNWHKIVVAYCGLPEEMVRHQCLAGARSSRNKLLSVGRLSPEKGQTLLLDMAVELKAKNYDFRLVIVGDGPDRIQLELAAAQKNIADVCTFLGAVDEQAVLEEMSRSDIFICPSLMEGLPQVLMEAMAAGVPTVAPYLSGIPELIEHRVTGLLFPVGDYKKMAEAVATLIDDSELSEAICEKAGKKIEEEFLLDGNIKPLLEHFMKIEDTLCQN